MPPRPPRLSLLESMKDRWRSRSSLSKRLCHLRHQPACGEGTIYGGMARARRVYGVCTACACGVHAVQGWGGEGGTNRTSKPGVQPSGSVSTPSLNGW
eukprot:scaffold43106_cov63-Phaeocystis_antarctica.AAC.2